MDSGSKIDRQLLPGVGTGCREAPETIVSSLNLQRHPTFLLGIEPCCANLLTVFGRACKRLDTRSAVNSCSNEDRSAPPFKHSAPETHQMQQELCHAAKAELFDGNSLFFKEFFLFRRHTNLSLLPKTSIKLPKKITFVPLFLLTDIQVLHRLVRSQLTFIRPFRETLHEEQVDLPDCVCAGPDATLQPRPVDACGNRNGVGRRHRSPADWHAEGNKAPERKGLRR